jgi:uncharacterized ion transporter superfamily protein YfcC
MQLIITILFSIYFIIALILSINFYNQGTELKQHWRKNVDAWDDSQIQAEKTRRRVIGLKFILRVFGLFILVSILSLIIGGFENCN